MYNVGDFVRIKPENDEYYWYTDEIFQILGFINKREIYIISKNLKTISQSKNSIYIHHVYQDIKCLKLGRKEKLDNLSKNNN